MMPFSFIPSSIKWNKIADAIRDNYQTEINKPASQRIKETIFTPYYIGKGVLKSGLNLLESGIKLTPMVMAYEQGKEIYQKNTDYDGYKTQKKKEFEPIHQALVQTYDQASQHPIKTLYNLWDKTGDFVTDKAVDFIKSPYANKMEMAGKIAPDIVMTALGVEEFSALSRASKWGKTYEEVSAIDKLSARNVILHESYKQELRMSMEKPFVRDLDLKNFLDEYWRDTGKVGNGSTAAAIRYERTTGNQVEGLLHSKKGKDKMIELEKWIAKHTKASPGDRAIAENLLLDIKDALR